MNGYILLRDSSEDGLAKKVQEHFHHGWTPQGGVAVYYNVHLFTTYYIQAMVI